MASKNGESKGSAKSKVLMVGVAVVGVAGLLKGFVLGGGASARVAATGGDAVTTTTAHGPIVTLEPISLNLEGGRYLKVGLGLQLSGDKAGETGAEDSGDPTKGYARALDLTIEVLGGRPFAELSTPEGRATAKEELTRRLKETYEDEVEGVYFTSFVMQ